LGEYVAVHVGMPASGAWGLCPNRATTLRQRFYCDIKSVKQLEVQPKNRERNLLYSYATISFLRHALFVSWSVSIQQTPHDGVLDGTPQAEGDMPVSQ